MKQPLRVMIIPIVCMDLPGGRTGSEGRSSSPRRRREIGKTSHAGSLRCDIHREILIRKPLLPQDYLQPDLLAGGRGPAINPENPGLTRF